MNAMIDTLSGQQVHRTNRPSKTLTETARGQSCQWLRHSVVRETQHALDTGCPLQCLARTWRHCMIWRHTGIKKKKKVTISLVSSPFPFSFYELYSWTYSEIEGQQIDQEVHRIVTKENEQIQRTAKQKVTGWHRKEKGNYPEQDSIGQTTVESTDWGLHPAVDGQRLSEVYGRMTW